MNSPYRKENCAICTVGCLLVTLFLAICGGIVSYYVFQFINMTNYYDLSLNCKTSNLWEYLLISCFTWLMLTFVGKAISLNIEFLMEKVIFMSIPTLFYLAMTCWGSFELFYNDKLCSDLQNTPFEKMGLANLIIQILLLVLSLILLVRFCNINN
jgi:hypothetical protein